MGVSVSKLAFPVGRAGAMARVPGLGLGNIAPARMGLGAPAPEPAGRRASTRRSHYGRNYRKPGSSGDRDTPESANQIADDPTTDA
jgi:hypothetical protein